MQLLNRNYSYDSFQRILHWWIALSTVLLLVSGVYGSYCEPGAERAFVIRQHFRIGYTLILSIVARFLWAFLGSKFARFESFFHWDAWMRSLIKRKIDPVDGPFGHHPNAALSYLVFYALIAAISISGLALAAILHGEGPLAESLLDRYSLLSVFYPLHTKAWYFVLLFIVAHIGAIIFHEITERIPIAQSIISGYQYRTIKEKVRVTKP